MRIAVTIVAALLMIAAFGIPVLIAIVMVYYMIKA